MDNPVDKVVSQYASYDDYLDSRVLPRDLYFLDNEELCRQLVETGYRQMGELISRADFTRRQRQLGRERQHQDKTPQRYVVDQGVVERCPLLKALAEREIENRQGKQATIVFIRDYNSRRQEVSGYIDLAHRLSLQNFGPIFAGKQKLLPRRNDLSYFNWDTRMATCTESPNYEVIADKMTGLLFKNKHDRKVVDVDPNCDYTGDNSRRVEITSEDYLQVVVFDHVVRRRV